MNNISAIQYENKHMQPVTVSILKAFDALKNVPDDELQWLIDNSKDYTVEDGEHITVSGQALEGPHFLISGRVQLYMMQNGGQREIAIFKSGDITGYLPFSRAVNAPGNSRAIGQVHLLTFPTDRVRELSTRSF